MGAEVWRHGVSTSCLWKHALFPNEENESLYSALYYMLSYRIAQFGQLLFEAVSNKSQDVSL